MLRAQAWDVTVADHVQQLSPLTPNLEARLEDWIERDCSIIGTGLLIIGRQVITSFGTFIDLLGMDGEGNLVIIELKREQTLRETVAQSLEYAAWSSELGYEDVVKIAAEHL